MEAWERFLSDSGEMSSHAVRHLIESSWRRCYSAGSTMTGIRWLGLSFRNSGAN